MKRRGEEAPMVLGLVRTMRHGRVVRRAATVSAVVGTLLTLINQGDVLVHLHLTPTLLWKIPLTDAVPYCVSIYTAVAVSRDHARQHDAPPA
jgi:hypothetical protein